jgi:glyoxylase-like metal-dependent hydrolase (beta-lactamase superfamily II)
MSKFETIQVGMLDVNCYLVPIKDKNRLYIIDPGAEAERIIAAAEKFACDDYVILLTHAHIDHISAVGCVAKSLNAPVVLDANEHGLYNSPNNQILPFMSAAKDLPKTVANISDADFEIIQTPGHTLGGVSFYFSTLPALFSGDTLFAQSVGRTDLPGGDHQILLDSINNQLMVLPETLPVYPGHGPATTIGNEKRHNPYL